jgi:hypothetical protein
MQRRSRLSAAALIAIVASACHPPVPEQAMSRKAPPPPATAPAAPVVAAGWAYHLTSARHSLVIEQRAELTIHQDTGTRTDSVFSRAEVAYSIFTSTGRLTGSVTTFRSRIGANPAARPVGLMVPFTFVATLPASRNQQIEFTTPATGADACASTALAVSQSLRDLWFQPPDILRAGASWDDSAAVTVCRDGIPLHTVVRRFFRVTTVDAVSAMAMITRTSHTVFDGQGSQAGEPVAISGSSEGKLIYTVEPATGTIVSALGKSTLALRLKSRLRNQDIRQTAAIEISIAR